jgi:GNAT superfamily N-acetyltransferase
MRKEKRHPTPVSQICSSAFLENQVIFKKPEEAILDVRSFELSDTNDIGHLQPEGWLPIQPYYKFYTIHDFCYPIKCIVHNKIVGVGSAIVHDQTGWLAHIIVDKDYRNQGIGTVITETLMNQLSPFAKTMHLLATPLGEPVYHKLGFKKDTAYVFLRDGKTEWVENRTIQAFQSKYKESLLRLDKFVSGENRARLLELHLEGAKIIVESGEVVGVFLRELGEGLVIALSEQAGEYLLGLKHSNISYASFPMENEAAAKFLLNHGFVEFRKAIRMYYGEKINWQPDKLFGRIGGNLG